MNSVAPPTSTAYRCATRTLWGSIATGWSPCTGTTCTTASAGSTKCGATRGGGERRPGPCDGCGGGIGERGWMKPIGRACRLSEDGPELPVYEFYCSQEC